MEKRMQCPMGQTDFEKLRRDGAVYVDKTESLYRMVQEGMYYVYSRPRGFGKSLMISTLKAYFEGKKELFEGLAMGRLEKEWTKHPVLLINYDGVSFTKTEEVEDYLKTLMAQWEKEYGVEKVMYEDILSIRFSHIIEAAHAKTGQRAVVLIDDYDRPLQDVFTNKDLLESLQRDLWGTYGVVKGFEEHLEFVLLTGITRFTVPGIFSGFNNLNDISTTDRFAETCGFTEQELRENFAAGVEQLAQRQEQTLEEAYAQLGEMYGGYKFTDRSKARLFHPASLLSALNGQEYGNYWYANGAPAFLHDMIVRQELTIQQLRSLEVDDSVLRPWELRSISLLRLLIQMGFLTIKKIEKLEGVSMFELCKLCIPNKEVEAALRELGVADAE